MFFQIEFYGASKGNPSPNGFGGVIIDDFGFIKHIILESLGYASNNVTNLWDLIHELKIKTC